MMFTTAAHSLVLGISLSAFVLGATAASDQSRRLKSAKSAKKSKSGGGPKPPPTPSGSIYVEEAREVLNKVIRQINNDDKKSDNRGVLQHGMVTPSEHASDASTYIIGMYEKNGKIEWNKKENEDLTTDSHAYCPEISTGCREYSSSWGLLSNGLKPVLFNAYSYNTPVPGFLVQLDKDSYIDKANDALGVVDLNTNERSLYWVSKNDPALKADIMHQQTLSGVKPVFRNYKCYIDCVTNQNGLCAEFAPQGSVSLGNHQPWGDRPKSHLPYVLPGGVAQAWVGPDGPGWKSMFAEETLFVGDGNHLDRICPFLRIDDSDPNNSDSHEVYRAWRRSTMAFQENLHRFCRDTGQCAGVSEGTFIEPEITIAMDKLKDPPTPIVDRSPIAFGDEFLAVSISTRTCKEYHVYAADMERLCGKEYFTSVGGEAKVIDEVKKAGCFLSLQLSQEFKRFIPALDVHALNNIMSFGNIEQWADPKWDDASNYITTVDCCKVSNQAGNEKMKKMFDDSKLAEFECA